MLHWLLPLLLIIGLPVAAQQSSPTTYAVIAGISNYASKGIPSLRFANKDAEAFYNYLRDDAKIPSENMKLMVNDEATTASIYSALSWLNEVAAKDDLVYFYFSGHGDMESETIYKLGFLLTHNTPRTNYINNAIRIEDINNFANTLSLKNKAKVVIITDACHSGNLAGSDFRGNSLVGKSLSVSKANEIRITSCRPDQESMEDEGWGGGRGVFSFHLINGLIGFAGKRNDDVITVKDIRRYLDSSLAKDAILQRENHRQNAVIVGPDVFPLAKKNKQRVEELRNRGLEHAILAPPQLPSGGAESLEVMMDEFAGWAKRIKLDSGFNYTRLDALPPEQIATAWIDMCEQKIVHEISSKDHAQRYLIDGMLHRMTVIKNAVASDSIIRKQLDRIFATSIHDYAQKVINDYLEGDAAELERRRYYNAGSSGYDVYPTMYNVAMKLTDPEDFLYGILNLNKYYFGGLALIAKVPMTEDPTALIDEAMRLERKALELEQNAPYIYNSIGTLHFYKGEFGKADSMYQQAMRMAPQWSLPYNNLLGLYIAQNKLDKANEMYQQAQEKSAELPDFYTNAGLLKELEGNYLLAEELQRKSIFLNSRHYLPFERLGNIYTHITNYALADSFYFEADVRKRGYYFRKLPHQVLASAVPEIMQTPQACEFDSTKIKSNDAAGYFTWGMNYFIQKNYAAAELKWKHLIQVAPSHPLAFYYLGRIQFMEKHWPEADLMFRFAIKNYLDADAAKKYNDSLVNLSTSLGDTTCFRKTFSRAIYPRENGHGFLGTVYREWHHYTSAEEQFRKLIAILPDNFAAHKTLWQMLEEIGKYQDAEAQIKLYSKVSADESDNELNAFYKRMIGRYADQPEWYLKAGVFLYGLVREYPERFEKDRKRIFPDQKIAEYVQLPVESVNATAGPTKLPGTLEMVYHEVSIEYPYSDAINYLTKIDSLVGNNTMLTADVNDKLGDLDSWQGVPFYAAKRYQASIDAAPANSGVRLKLINAYHITYQFGEAVNNLVYLRVHNELNLEKMILFGDYSMRQSKFNLADSLLTAAKNIYPFVHNAVLDLQAKNYLLQRKADQAIKSYQALLASDASNSAAMYSISRMYAVQNDNKKVMQWLNNAYDHGFNYKWVLDNDPLMKEVRKTNDWQVFISTKKFLHYPEPSNSFPRKTTE